jgi:hypothetical protein
MAVRGSFEMFLLWIGGDGSVYVSAAYDWDTVDGYG